MLLKPLALEQENYHRVPIMQASLYRDGVEMRASHTDDRVWSLLACYQLSWYVAMYEYRRFVRLLRSCSCVKFGRPPLSLNSTRTPRELLWKPLDINTNPSGRKYSWYKKYTRGEKLSNLEPSNHRLPTLADTVGALGLMLAPSFFYFFILFNSLADG